jgi:Flp pilus assembly protein TadG
MRRSQAGAGRRDAVVTPFAAFVMVILVGMLAFSIDIGYVVAVQAELQNAADAAALAGAQRLEGPFVQFYSPGQTDKLGVLNSVIADTTTPTGPTCTAQRFAALNTAGGVSVTVPSSDVSFSYWDGTNDPVAASLTNFPNTVTVTVRRDATANGSLGLFFARIFGKTQIDLTATASATIYAGDVSSLQSIPGVNAHILPVALDVNFWKKYVSTGQSPDGTIVLGPNGLPQLHVYPYPGNAPGSFGLLDVGPPQNNAPAFRSWIDDGSTPNDISYLLSNNLLPVSPSAPEPWKTGPGLKSTLVSDFQSVMGEPNLIPLFVPVNDGSNGQDYQAASGTGQNATYAIVGFAGVTVTQATGQGSSMDISVQPMAIVDPTAVILNPKPAGSGNLTWFGTSQTTFVSAKLTR